MAYYGIRLAISDCDLTLGSADEKKVKQKFRNKRVWITGGSSGIGKALAIRIGKIEGSTILISARSESALRDVQKLITEAGGKCEVLVLDLADLPSLNDKVREARELLGGDIDILVNNGGISQRSMAKDTGFETDMQIMKVDFLSASILTKAMLETWLNRADKSEPKGVISIASLAGKMGVPLRTFYCAAKFALVGFMDSLRSEVSSDGNIVFTNICAGSVCTNIAKNALVGNGEKFGVTDAHIANGMNVDRCAGLIVKGYANELPEVWMFGSAKEKVGVYLAQYMPAIFQQIVVKGNTMMKRNYTEMILAAREKEKQ
jgi:short-subunit dehydrogenase